VLEAKCQDPLAKGPPMQYNLAEKLAITYYLEAILYGNRERALYWLGWCDCLGIMHPFVSRNNINNHGEMDRAVVTEFIQQLRS